MKRLTTRLAMNPAWTLGQHTECSGGVSSLFCRMHELGLPVENWGSGIFLDRSSEAGAADEGLDQHHRGASRACSKLVFFVVAFLLKSVSKRNDAWLYATSVPKDVALLFQ